MRVRPKSARSVVSIDAQIASSSDDAEERVATGTVHLSSSDLELVEDSTDQLVALRFDRLFVPPSAQIVKAYVQFAADEVYSGETLLEVQGEATDHALPFGRTNGDISSRVLTDNSVHWSPPGWTRIGLAGEDQRTPDLSSVVQEIVNRHRLENLQRFGIGHTWLGPADSRIF